MCATHGAMGNVSAVNISCEVQQVARGRFLFVAANVDGYSICTWHIMDIITEQLILISPFVTVAEFAARKYCISLTISTDRQRYLFDHNCIKWTN